MKREPYLTDLSNEQWALTEPRITAWKQIRVARSTTGDFGCCDLRQIANANFYQNQTGCKRSEDLSLVVTDTQSVRAATGVPKATTGLDVNKKMSGRKRGLAVDVLGLVIGVAVLAASAHDNAASTALLDQATDRCGNRLEEASADHSG
ncbi:hypothetical protein [Streptomyces sp. NPDC059165]|uniref:hypothetical protein n=1 Tax=Streptomyces sp. NPDC059165 TaxID=3346751 RepID=UPI0036923E95